MSTVSIFHQEVDGIILIHVFMILIDNPLSEGEASALDKENYLMLDSIAINSKRTKLGYVGEHGIPVD